MQNIGEKVMLGYNKLLIESCTYSKYVDNDEYNQKVYEADTTLKCFVSFDFSNDRSFTEQNTNLIKKIFISNDITPDIYDKFDGSEVVSIKPVKSLVSGIIGWEVLV